MYPVIFEGGGVVLYSYGIFVALGVALAITLGCREAARSGILWRRALDTALVAVIFAFIGARALYVALEWRYFAEYPTQIFGIWNGGLVYYGGFVAGIAGGAVYARLIKLDPWALLDSFAPGTALGSAAGRIGCFLAGCCYGKPSMVPWAVGFTDERCLARLDFPLHPVQLYSAAADVLTYLFLRSRLRSDPKRDGRVFATYLVVSATFRIVLEIYRGDPRGNLGGFSTSQIAGIVMMAAGFAILWRRGKTPARGNGK